MTDPAQAARNELADLAIRVKQMQYDLGNPNLRGSATDRLQWAQAIRAGADRLWKHIYDMDKP
jgi:hypothetical protein